MAKIPFKVSARAGKLLGRENFSNPEGAIIELIKNSYDADAKNCFVFFDIPVKIKKDTKGNKVVIPNKEKSNIYIIDNGEGMTKKVIEDHWMKIGTGNKEKDFISDDKRVKTGANGIGRFALDRLGFKTELWTISKKSKQNSGLYWEMDWNQFDEAEKSISEIKAELKQEIFKLRKLIESIGIKHSKFEKLLNSVNFINGTFIKVTNLKDEWYKTNIDEVFKSLEALIPPKELNIQFEVFFSHLQEIGNYGNVETAFFNDYDYRLKATYDSKSLNVHFEMTRNELDLKLVKKQFSHIYKGSRKPFNLKTLETIAFKYSKSIEKVLSWDLNGTNRKLLKDVGSFSLTFYYLKFYNSKKEGYPYKIINRAERKSVLDRFGGVKVYRDSFRVRPYGEPTNDWLKLGARVAQSPAGAGQRVGDWRVRPEQTAGIITISRKTNPLLVDKSDRGALQENDAFDTFKRIIVGVIHEFELDRTKILNPYYLFFKKEKARAKEKEIQERAEKLAEQMVEERKNVEERMYGKRKVDLFQEKREEEEKKKYKKTFEETIREIDDKYSQKENEEIVQVRALASLGLIVSSFGHELKEVKNNATEINLLEGIYKKLIPDSIKKSSKHKEDFDDGLDIIELLKENSDKIKHWVEYSQSAIRKDKRKRSKLDFSAYFKGLRRRWNKIFKTRDIRLKTADRIKGADYDFRAFEMDMDTVFTNLINNSIDSFSNLKAVQDRNITIEFELSDFTIDIIYSDNGVGLSKVFEDKEEIFLPFTTTKRDRKGNDIGTGMGMYLIKNVIEGYNGDVQILEPQEGFSLKLSFPIRKKQ